MFHFFKKDYTKQMVLSVIAFAGFTIAAIAFGAEQNWLSCALWASLAISQVFYFLGYHAGDLKKWQFTTGNVFIIIAIVLLLVNLVRMFG